VSASCRRQLTAPAPRPHARRCCQPGSWTGDHRRRQTGALGPVRTTAQGWNETVPFAPTLVVTVGSLALLPASCGVVDEERDLDAIVQVELGQQA